MNKSFANQSNTSTEISPIKQQLLWDKIIFQWLSDNNQTEVLLTAFDSWYLAYKAREAFAILQNYQISIDSLKKSGYNKETKVFLEWLDIYINLCNKFNYYNSKSEFNFHKISSTVITSGSNINLNTTFKIACQDINQELEYAARFALSNGIQKTTLVVLNLEDNFNKIDYVFSNYFKKHQYEIYLSPKLSDNYIIKLSLLILNLANCYINKEQFKYEEFSKLLRTKYISGSLKESNSRVYIDYTLREKIDYKFDWQYIIDYLSTNLSTIDREAISVFINLCVSFVEVLTNKISCLINKQHGDFWIQFIEEILKAFGWCVEIDQLNFQEQQTLVYWFDILNLYRESQDFIASHDFTECIMALTKLVQVYKMKNDFNQSTTVSIMDLQTALQNKFEYLWICGLDEFNWPLECELNPFLPTKIQKEVGFPYGSKKNSKFIFEQFLQQLIHNTKNIVICSYPIYIDGNLVRPSNLIKHFPEYTEYNFSFNLNVQHDMNVSSTASHLELESYIDEHAPKYELAILPGTQVFKMQNACPFQANAKIRLKAKNFAVPVPYLSKATKGEILHKTLASFWASFSNNNNSSSSYKLKSLSDIEIREKLFNIAHKVLKVLHRFKPTTLNKLTMTLEINRVVNLCFDFIKKYDLHRSDFQVIHIEKKFTVKLKEYLINIKVDRIDELSDGNLIIIDYKTGNAIDLAQFKLFDFNKINDPQFIVYSLYSSKVKALILANIRADELKLIGAVDNQANLTELYSLPDFKYTAIDNWQQHLTNCYEDLYKLAKDFNNGEAAVNPKQGDATCNQCDLHSMCRVYIDR